MFSIGNTHFYVGNYNIPIFLPERGNCYYDIHIWSICFFLKNRKNKKERQRSPLTLRLYNGSFLIFPPCRGYCLPVARTFRTTASLR